MSFKSSISVILAIMFVASVCEENLTVVDSNVNETESTSQESNVTSEKDAEALEFDNYSRKLLDEMGINKEKEISRERFTQFLTRLITRDEKLEPHEQDLYVELIQRVVAKAPETIQVSEISKYIQQDQMVTSLNELIRERYGEEALQQFEKEVNSDL
jgi:hypothetical protein